MARHCPDCGHPTQPHDSHCGDCHAALLGEAEAREAQDRWTRLPAGMKEEMAAEHARRCEEWVRNRDFYERKSVWKHLTGAALVFGVAGAASGYMALGYALLGVLGGKILNRRKGGIFLGTLVGAGIFVAVLVIRTLIVACLRIEPEAFLKYVALSHYADRIAGLVCPAAGGILGYLIEQEFEERG